MNKLLAIQTELKAPKNQHNSFGNYNFRNKEDILEALKPLLAKYECSFWITDSIVQMGNRFYVKAVATFVDGDMRTIAEGWAREEEAQKGMQGPQISGSASSYAGKYALGNLFLLDDTKDSDSLNKHDEPTKAEAPKPTEHKAPVQGEIKRYIGTIKARKEGKMGFVSFDVGPFEVSSKKPEIIAQMDAALDKGCPTQIDYNEVVNGRWTNRYIVSVTESEEVPF